MTERTRIGRGLRIAVVALTMLIAIPAVAAIALYFTFDANRLKPEIAEVVRGQTGRELAVSGPISLNLLSLAPTIEMRDVALANLPGGSRPAMVTLDRLEAQVALLPLLSRRVEIRRLVLLHPTILLETVQGQPNWRLLPESKPAPQTQPASGTPKPRATLAFSVLQIKDGALSYRDHKGHVTALAVPSFETKAASFTAPINISGVVAFHGENVAIAGELGSLSRLQDRTATTPWPVHLMLAGAGAKIGLLGSLTEPLQGRGYDLGVDGTIDDLARLGPFAPRARLPALRDIGFSAKIADAGGPMPQVSNVVLHAGSSALDQVTPGLKLTKLSFTAPNMNEPARAEATGTLAAAPFAASAMIGAPALWRQQDSVVPLDITVQAAGANASANGRITDPMHLPDANFVLSARVPDAASLSPLAHRILPPIKDVAFSGTLQLSGDRANRTLALQGAKLTLPEGDLEANVALSRAPRPSLRASLASHRIDFDSLEQAFASPPSSPPNAQTAASSAQSGQQQRATKNTGQAWLIPDTPLPFDLLRIIDADIQVTVGELRAGGETYRDATAHLLLADSRLQIEPFTASLPTGRLTLKLSADDAAPAPQVAIALDAPGVPLRPLLIAAGLPADARGNLEIAADLRGQGRSLHQLAATLSGKLGIATVNGSIDTRLLQQTLGPLLRDSKLPTAGGQGGLEAVNCLALSAEAKDGVTQIRSLGLESALMDLSGAGSANLGNETLALYLRPLARLGHAGVVVPVRVTGSFRAPKIAVDIGPERHSEEGRNSGPAGLIIGALGANGAIAGAELPSCANALADARQGRTGPMPQTARPNEPAKPPKPADLLRQLLR